MVHEADGFGVSGVDGPSGRPVLGMLAIGAIYLYN